VIILPKVLEDIIIKENIQFCRIARGSLTESLNQVITALDENYIEEDLLQKFRERFERTKAILNGYINYLAKTKME
jgi:four helix bundle protein